MNKLFSNQGTFNLEDIILIYKKDILNVLKWFNITKGIQAPGFWICFDTSKALRHILWQGKLYHISIMGLKF